jgi:hypothetical protein
MKRGRFFFWLVAGPVAILAAMLAAAHPYLAVTDRSGSDVLVVEGWMQEEHLRQIPRWVDSLHYQRVYTTGSVRPFAYYLKVGEAIEVRFAEPLHGRVSIDVGGLPGAGFRMMAGNDTVLERYVDSTPARFLSDGEVATDRLRITAISSVGTDFSTDIIFIKYLYIGDENAHLLQDTTLFVRRDSTLQPAWPTYAHKCKADLERFGVKAEVIAVPSWGKPDSRSWANASFFGVRAKADKLTSCDVVTVGVHARRSRGLFRQACGPEVNVGVISLEDPECPRDGWWHKRNGWIQMLKEIGGSGEPLAVDLTR